MRRKRHSDDEVELNLAAMLDMAFQLLTFFILTFKPAPVEGQVNLRLPPPEALPGGKAEKGEDTSAKEPPKGLTTLVISVFGTKSGAISTMAVGDTEVRGLSGLSTRLKTVFGDAANPFDQVVVQVGSEVRYDELMKVVEICTQQTLADGTRLGKLSFVEAPTGN